MSASMTWVTFEDEPANGHPRIAGTRYVKDYEAADALRASLKASPNPSVLLVKPPQYSTLERGTPIKVVTTTGSYYGTLIDVSTKLKHNRNPMTGEILSSELVGNHLSYVPVDNQSVWKGQILEIEKSVVSSGMFLLYRVPA